MNLAVQTPQRYGRKKPPDRRYTKGNCHGIHLRKARFRRRQYERKSRDKRNAAADIPPCKPSRRHFIHTLRRRYVRKHGVIKDQTCRKSAFGDDKDDQKYKPCAHKSQRQTSCRAKHHTAKKNRLLPPFKICHRTEHRPGYGYNHRNGRSRISPVRQIIYRRKSALLCNRVKIDRKQRRYKQHKRRISHVI